MLAFSSQRLTTSVLNECQQCVESHDVWNPHSESNQLELAENKNTLWRLDMWRWPVCRTEQVPEQRRWQTGQETCPAASVLESTERTGRFVPSCLSGSWILIHDQQGWVSTSFYRSVSVQPADWLVSIFVMCRTWTESRWCSHRNRTGILSNFEAHVTPTHDRELHFPLKDDWNWVQYFFLFFLKHEREDQRWPLRSASRAFKDTSFDLVVELLHGNSRL